MSQTTNAGIVTAYGAAVRGGYQGSYNDFCTDLANLTQVVNELANLSATAETLVAGSAATATYSNGVFSFGIPRGDKGETGDTGNGIESVSLLSTSGLNKTYRITFTDGTHFDYVVADGKSIVSTVLNVDYTLTITYNDGTTWTSESIRGATGATPNLTIGTVITGAAGTPASAEITGTAEDPVLNLTIPKGADGDVSPASLASTYSASQTYAVGDYVWYSGQLYCCTTAITTAEAWTAAHWTAAKLADDVKDLKSSLGTWYYTKTMTSRYPWIQTDDVKNKVYFKLIEPLNVTLVTIFGIANGQQTELYRTTEKEFIATLSDVSGYDALKYAINLPESATVNYRAIIHGFDDHTISQNIVDLKYNTQDQIDKILSNFVELYIPDEQMEGTNYNGYYLNSGNRINQISNTSFNVRAYSVEANKAYFIRGEGVRLNAELPLCGFGTDAVANNAIVKEVILNGTTTPTDYDTKYIPTEEGYIYVSWVTGQIELSVYDSELVSDSYMKLYPDGVKPVKIQLFGDSITDNKWGDLKTWADYISDNMGGYNVTVVNDAVGGSGLGHGKSTTTPSHQDDEYNYVYDLVTDGTTLQTDADAIVILAGTNNWASGTDLGNMASTGYSTIYGALKGILNYISTHSKATVFICTIPQRYNTTDQSREVNSYGEPLNPDGVTLAEYCEPFRILSAFYGMPCVPLNEALGWNRLNISNFSADGLHPNQTGDKMLAKYICSEIKKHI